MKMKMKEKAKETERRSGLHATDQLTDRPTDTWATNVPQTTVDH